MERFYLKVASGRRVGRLSISRGQPGEPHQGRTGLSGDLRISTPGGPKVGGLGTDAVTSACQQTAEVECAPRPAALVSATVCREGVVGVAQPFEQNSEIGRAVGVATFVGATESGNRADQITLRGEEAAEIECAVEIPARVGTPIGRERSVDISSLFEKSAKVGCCAGITSRLGTPVRSKPVVGVFFRFGHRCKGGGGWRPGQFARPALGSCHAGQPGPARR